MPTPNRSSRVSLVMATLGIVAGILLAAGVGVYLGRTYIPRSTPAQIARQPAPSPPTTPVLPETPVSAPKAAPAAKSRPQPSSHPVRPVARPSPPHPARTAAAHAHVAAARVAERKPAVKQREAHRARIAHERPHRTVVAALPLGARERHPSRAHRLAPRPARLARRPAPARRMAQTGPLRPVAVMPPVRPLPVPREVRQRQVARRLAARLRRERGYRHRSRSWRLARVPRRPMITAAVEVPVLGGAAATRAMTLTPAQIRSAQTVRYVEQPVLLENQPATLATYIVWGHGIPRTFSFVRQQGRTDLARIVAVDPATRQVRALIPARGALVQAAVPVTVMMVYRVALQMNPPPPEVIARATALSQPGLPAGAPFPPAPLPAPPTERVAGMREIVGKVQSVDPASRIIILAGPRGKTPFQVPVGTPLPRVGTVISLIAAPDGTLSPLPATGYIPLQPTVEGQVTRVVPTAVELTVRTVSPDGQVMEVPVPVTGNAEVFIAGQPGDLRALKKGIYIRAYMTPTGETRILGMPSE